MFEEEKKCDQLIGDYFLRPDCLYRENNEADLMAVYARVSAVKGSRERTFDHENVAIDSLRCE